MYFSDLTSQDASKKQLLNLFSQNRVPHALLLSGPEGCGHLQLALSFAALLSCNNPQENDACKKCSSCLKHEKFQHPDIHFSFPIHLLKSEHSEISDHRRDTFVKTLIELKCLGKKARGYRSSRKSLYFKKNQLKVFFWRGKNFNNVVA